MIVDCKLENQSGLTTAQKIKKRQILQGTLHGLNRNSDFYATYHVKRKQKIIAASSATIVVLAIAAALTAIILTGGFVPFVLLTAVFSGFAAFFSSCAIIAGVYTYRSRIKDKSQPICAPMKLSLDTLISFLHKNINRQKEEFDEEVKLETFFQSDQGVEASVAYRELSEKRDNKLAALKDDLEVTKKEKEVINEAHVATLTLIQKHLTPENVKEAELEVRATGRSTNPHYVYLDHRFSQEVAKKLCAKKIETLETAIELHQGNHVVSAKHNKYRQNKKMDVKTDPLHYTVKRMGDALFLWQDNKGIRKTASKMVDSVVQDYQKEAEAEIAECRKTWF
jgi:hypothetical protein